MLEEKRVLKSVEYLFEGNVVHLLWEDRILRDGTIISANNHRLAVSLNDFTSDTVDFETLTLLKESLPDLFKNV